MRVFRRRDALIFMCARHDTNLAVESKTEVLPYCFQYAYKL